MFGPGSDRYTLISGNDYRVTFTELLANALRMESRELGDRIDL